MSYLFFIYAATNNCSVIEIQKALKVEKEKDFKDSSIIYIKQDAEYKLYLGYFKKKSEKSSVQTKILIDINDKTFESKIFEIPKDKSIFLSHIEFSYHYSYFLGKFKNPFFKESIIPPKCHKLDIYTALKIYLENLYKLIHKDKNQIKFQLLNYFNEQYQKSNEKTLQFYLLLFKHCYDYNSKNNKKIELKFDFNLKVANGNFIEKEFGEMIDDLSFNYDLNEKNDDLIKLILFYYHKINENKFHEFLENNNIIKKIISIIIQNHYFFRNIKKRDLIILIQNANSIQEIGNILNLSENIEEKLKIVNELFDHIYNFFEKNQKSIKLTGDYSLLNKENKIKEILNQYYDINIRKPSQIMLLEIDFPQLIKSNQKFQSLKEIKNVINNLYYFFIENNDIELKELLQLQNNLEKNIHELGVALILKNEMSNMEIVTFIDEDSHIKELGEKKNNPYLTYFYRKIYFNKSLDLIDHIKIGSINEEFIIKFKKIKFHSIYGQFENYPKLIDKLFNGAQNIKNFIMYSNYFTK